MPRVIPSIALIAAALLLTACASPSSSVTNPDDVNNTSRVYPETLQPRELRLPASLMFADGLQDLSEVTSHRFDFDSLVDLGWVADLNENGVVFLRTSECQVMLSISPYNTTPGTLEIDNTALFLSQYTGTTTWDEILPAQVKVNGTVTMEALVVSGVMESGRYEIAVARVLGGISQAYLLSLVCIDGVATENIFIDEVVPNISIEMT